MPIKAEPTFQFGGSVSLIKINKIILYIYSYMFVNSEVFLCLLRRWLRYLRFNEIVIKILLQLNYGDRFT